MADTRKQNMRDRNCSFDLAMKECLGERGWLTCPEDQAAHARDWLDRYGEVPLGIARPASTAEVSAIVRICAEHGISIVPQGGNTSLNGGSVATSPASVILSMARMNRIHTIDAVDFTATVEAGVVLADGTVWDGSRALIKDNAGYQLRRLFCGSEGTLGIVTKAVLRLFPAPVARATALLALPDLDAALRIGALLRALTGEFLTAVEFFNEPGLSLLLKHVPHISRPLEIPGPVYLLVEIATSIPEIVLPDILDRALSAAFETGDVLDGTIATSEAQRAALWRIREELPEGQRLEGRQIKHDVSVPVARLAAFVAEASAGAARVLAGVRVNPFGHLGDGNVHFNLSPPEGRADFEGREMQLSQAVYEAAVGHGGSIAAEHGLGQAKVELADRFRSATERSLMRQLKSTLDPHGIMNPGKVV
jgi:FAD/FMN-containing dehydrogenase